MKSTGHALKLTVLAMAFWCLLIVVLSVGAHAANLNVYCGVKRHPNTINGALKFLNPQGPNTLTVYGACNENVLIQTFDNLTLQAAAGGATINDASGGTNNVINISDSTRITIQGFAINGTNGGIFCFNQSLCRLTGNTIQGGSDFGVRADSGSRATLTDNVIQNSGDGLHIMNGSWAVTLRNTIQGNPGVGIFVSGGSFLRARSTTVQGNGSMGVVVADNSTLASVGGNVITGNGDTGVLVLRAAVGTFTNGDVITANGYGLAEYGGNGVSIWDASFGRFLPGVNITGNFSGTDVECRGQFPVAVGLENIAPGTTNCVVPSRPSDQTRQGAR
jgi:parallel beta-helix repeat protein